jgi:hemerythrin-like domain-containing protein
LKATHQPGFAVADILRTLKSEHDELRDMFEKLNDTTDRAIRTRQDLLSDIETALVLHAKWEEEVFYPAFRERADRDGLQIHAEAIEEHRAVEATALPDLKHADVGTPQFAGMAKVLSELVKHHAKEEESALFKQARSMFSSEEREQLDEDYAAWKQSKSADQALSRPSPPPPPAA